MKSMSKTISLVLVAAGVLAAAGCAQEVEDINRVQNNVTKKAELKGEFYFRSTVVEAPYTSIGYFVGDQNYNLERGVFEIQENTLFFYRTYEVIIGGETQGASPDIDTPLYETDEQGEIVLDENGKPVPVTYQRRIGDELVTVQRFVYRGSPIVAFPIDSHFDIHREYNPVTGEETNVIGENVSDREWHQREYMRVSWGLSSNVNAISVLSGIGGLVEVVDAEFDSEEAPVKVYREDGTLDYFDYQSRKVITAPTAELEGYGTIPACWYYPWYLGQVAECNSEKITFRHAFMRVKPSDYVAWDYDDTHLKKFGFYREERASYDATYGTTYSQVSRRIRRFRIWENYEVIKGAECTTPNNDAQGTCAAGEVCMPLDDGLFCVNEDANERLDYATMIPKPIVWYLSEEFPRELVPETIKLGADWNPPFKDVVEYRRGEELDHAALRPDMNVPESQTKRMFIVCENSLDEAAVAMARYGYDINDPEDVAKAQSEKVLAEIGGFCADMDTAKRNGDLRYSQIHSVNAPTSVGLYGYGPSSADPMTGEILSANSYMYTPAMKRGANNAMIAIEILTGIRNFWETTYANQIAERSEKTRLGAATGGLPKYDVGSAQASARTMLSPKVATRLEVAGIEQSDSDWAADRMSILARKDPQLASLLVTEDVKLLHRDPSVGADTGETATQLVDRLGMQNWGHFSGNWGKKLKRYEHSHEGGCKFYEEFADNGILGLAREYADQMNQRVCEQVGGAEGTIFDFQEFEELQGTCDSVGAESEDGLFRCEEVVVDDAGTKVKYWTNPCTIGKLKVQLVDTIKNMEQTNPYNHAQNYATPDPLYTDTKHEIIQRSQMALLDAIEPIRDEMITRLWKRIYLGVAEHEIGHSVGLRHNFEASTDAMNFGTAYWDLKGQFDGSGNFNAFDMFAGETFHQATGNMRQMQSASVMDYSAKFNDRFEGVGWYDRAAIRFGYGGLVEVFNQEPEVDPFLPYMEDPLATDPTNLPTVREIGSTMLERMFKRVHYTKIPELFGDIKSIYDRQLVPYSQIEDGMTEDGKYEVPYRFCSDELAGRLPTCERWDAGVDSFEIVRNALNDYESYWPIWGYWHDSVLFQPDLYYNRVVRTFYAVKLHMQWWVTQYQQFNRNDWWKNRFGVAWHEDPLGGLAGSVSIIDSANTLAQTFGRPETSQHGFRGSREVFEPVPFTEATLYNHFKLITPLNCDARNMYPSYDYSAYLPKITRAGAIYDRLAAYEALADPSSNFLATDETNDVQKYLISYYNLFPKELSNLFASMLANRTEGWGWYMVTKNNKPERCHRRNVVGPQAMDIDEVRAMVQQDDTEADKYNVWKFNPEPEYTFPTTRFRLPMLAAYYGLGLFTGSFDNSFVDLTRVYVDGHLAAIEPSPDAEVLSFTDPLSGKTYSAVRPGNSEELFNPAAYMIERMQEELASYPSLQDLQENYNYSEYQFILDKLELLRGMNYLYDYN